MSENEDFVALNRAHWDATTPGHLTSAFYDVDGFRAGRDTIDDIEAAVVGDVSGLRLLHLQCHFGLDTMSWTRRGAIAAGVDFSEVAIAAGRTLAADLGLDTRFVVGDVLDLDLGEEFDVVFTSHGVLGWLPELESWAATIARHLRPGGRFYLVDSHPIQWVFDDDRTDGEMRLRYDYFDRAAHIFTAEGSYADPGAPLTTTAERIHPVADTLGSLIGAGLIITGYQEYDRLAWQGLPHMVCGDDGWWRLPPGSVRIPLTMSVSAMKPA